MFKNLQEIIEADIQTSNGVPVQFTGIIYQPIVAKTKNGDFFLSCQIRANNFTVSAKKWQYHSDEDVIFQQGNLVNITGVVNVFRDKKQIIINHYELNEDPKLLQELLPTPPVAMSELKSEFERFVAQIVDSDYAKIIEAIFTDQVTEAFYSVRAGLSIHHNVYGGLLWHTVSLLQGAENLLKTYNYLAINKSLLFAGIILHDIGKIWEIGDFFQLKYSLRGKLLGHISIGSALVAQVNQSDNLQVPEEKLSLLQHVILTSHGKLENGSPIRPIIPESLITSQLDNMDAKINQFYTKTKDLKVGEYSERLFGDDNKPIEYFIHQTHSENQSDE